MSYEFKTDGRWKNLPYDEIVYCPEDGTMDYTKADLIDLCKGNEETAMQLLDSLEWQHPSTLLEEWLMEGEIDDNYKMIPQD